MESPDKKGVSFPKDERKMAYVFFYDKHSIYVPLNEEEQQTVQELYDYNDRMGIPAPLTVYDIRWGVVCELCDDDTCEYCVTHYESENEKNADDQSIPDNVSVNTITSVTSASSSNSIICSSSVANDDNSTESFFAKPRKSSEKRRGKSKPKRSKSLRRQRSNNKTVKPAAANDATTSSIARPKSNVRHNNDYNYHTKELDDDSIGWVQPEWTKKLNLKMSDKGTAVRTKGLCLAQPVTFCKKDPNRGVNNVANKTILKASDTWKQFHDGAKVVNLAKPITFCKKDPKRTVNTIANKKVLRKTDTWKKGSVVNLAKPVTFCKQDSKRNVNYIANKNVLKSTNTWKNGRENLAKPVTFCEKDSNRNLNLVANQQILKKKDQIINKKKDSSMTRRRSTGITKNSKENSTADPISSSSNSSCDSNISNSSSDCSTDKCFNLDSRVSTGGVTPSFRSNCIQENSIKNQNNSLGGGRCAKQSILAKTDLGERIRLGKNLEFIVTADVVAARKYECKNNFYVEKPKWARTQLKTSEQGKSIRLSKTT